MKKIINKITSFLLVLCLLPIFQPMVMASAEEKIEWFFYADFEQSVSDAKFGMDHVFPADGSTVKQMQEDVGFLRLLPNDKAGTQVSKFIEKVPGKPKIVAQFRIKAFLDSASSSMFWSKTNGDSLIHIQRGEQGGIYDKANGTKLMPFSIPERELWYDFSIVYDNEKDERTIYINGENKGTFQGNNYASTGDFKFNISASINATSYVDIDYIKIFSYSDSFDPANTELSPNASAGDKPSEDAMAVSNDELLLKALGLYNGTGDLSSQMTRGEFAAMVLKFMNVPPAEYEKTYRDVPSEHKYAREINTLYYIGGISRDTEARFRPDDNITIYEACVIFINVLGYSDRAIAYGGYPYGYHQLSNELKLLKGLSGSAQTTLTRGDIFAMSVNFLNTAPMMIYAIGKDGYEAGKSNETILNIYHRIFAYEGIINANSITTLDKPEGMDVECFAINDKVIKGSNMDHNLGKKAVAYCDEDDNLLYCVVDRNNSTEKIYYDQIVSYQDGKLTYTINEREKRQVITSNVYLLYNGKAIKNYNSDLYNIDYGYIELLDNNGDSKPDVIFINEFVNYQVVGYEESSEAILVEKNPAIKLEENITILDKNNLPIKASQVKKGNILSVMYDEDNNISGVFYGTDRVSGKITSMESGDKLVRVGLDNSKEYIVDSNFIKKNTYVGLGSSGTFYLDIMGNIAGYSEYVSTSDIYGYFITARKAPNEDEFGYFKILSENGKMLSLKSKEKITIDAERKPATEVVDMLNNKGGQLIRYTLDKDGDLSKVDTTASSEKESELNRIDEFYAGEQIYYIDPKSFGGYVFFAGSCKVFCIPPDPSKAIDDDYSVADHNALVNGKSYAFKAYKSSTDSIGADVIVVNAVAEAYYDRYEYVSVLSKVNIAVNDMGEVGHKVNYFYKGVEYETFVEDTELFKDRQAGDVMLLAFDATRNIIAYKLLYDSKTDKLANNEGKEKRYTTHRNCLGYVYSIDDGLFNLAINDPALYPEEQLNMEIHRFTKYIYVYDTKKDKVTIGGMADIVDYKSGAVNYSKLFIFDTYCVDYDIVVIK